MIQDVSVETQVADVEPVGPPVIVMPEATPTPFVPKTRCEDAQPKSGWMPEEDAGKDRFELYSKGRNAAASGVLGSLEPGEALEFFVYVDAMPNERDIVGHSLELFLQDKEAEREGWVLSFMNARDSRTHGNMIRAGLYRSESFEAGPYRAGSWNQIRMGSCADGQVHLRVNGKDATVTLPSGLRSHGFGVRAVGLRAVISKNPRAPLPTPTPLALPPPGGL
jgi:hypothetical protein